MAEFKIGRLRFTWAGTWAADTFYNRDAVVHYQGKTYVCLVPNTSSQDFYTDLNAVPFPAWNLVIDGTTWHGPWQTGTLYSRGNIVQFGGVAYYCVTEHTSTAFASDANKWIEYIEFANWLKDWTPNTVYGVNDIVRYGGINYKCKTNHTSAGTVAAGLEANFSAWDVYTIGIDFKGNWAPSTRYKLNDVVKLDVNLYKANVGHTSTTSFEPADWDMWLPGLDNFVVWDQATIFQIGDTIRYGGYNYISKTANNVNNIPSTSTDNWALLNTGYRMQDEWSNSSSYKIGDVVNRHGQLFEAVADNNAQDPTSFSITHQYNNSSSGTTLVLDSTSSLVVGMNIIGTGFNSGQSIVSIVDSTTAIISKAPDATVPPSTSLQFVGVNYPYWKLVVSGVNWTKNWTTNTTYASGDVVIWKNATYICINTHVSGSLTSPDLDLTNTYWTFYVPHFRKNALVNKGDIETYDNGGYSPVSIGTDTYTLRATDNKPTWSHINAVNKVYYVSETTGQDLNVDNWGATWDKPWKTISYATQVINTSILYPTAVALLKANRAWMTTEMYQWMLYQKSTSTSPFTSQTTFDQTKTIRDAEIVIDAVTYDLTRGGNSQTVAATLAYFAFGQTGQFFNSNVSAQMPIFIAALQQLLSLMQSAISESTPGVSYQTLNNVAANLIVHQDKSVTLPGGAPDSAAGARIGELMGILTSALSTQNTTFVPASNNGISATIFVKTGTYNEALPILVPDNVAIVGDELRGVTVEPLTRIITSATASNDVTDLFTVTSTAGFTDQMPVQFVSPDVRNNITFTGFGGITPGQTYYIVGSTVTPTKFGICDSPTTTFVGTTVSTSNVISDIKSIIDLKVGATITGANIPADTTIIAITPASSNLVMNSITISNNATGSSANVSFTVTGARIALTAYQGGNMTVYAGDCLKNMFLMRNGTGLRNMTLKGLLGTLGARDENMIQRPTGGSFVSLDPGIGPNDPSGWILRRSPYIQNVTAFGDGCTALKIDGNLHNGGNKSIVANDFTHIVNDGIGVWCTGPSALTEVVSVFSYYGYTGYFAEAGGRIRATNGNTSYGQYGVIAEGYDQTETPATGTIFNQSTQVQATVQQAYGSNSQLLRMQYQNAGNNYATTTTNLITYSNNFLGANWSTDGNVSFAKVTTAPTGLTEAWTLTGGIGGPDGSYIYQNIAIPAAGTTYTNVGAVNITGSGGTGANTPATFNITVTSTAYIVTVNTPGSGYAVTNQMYIAGSQLGGINSVNDCVITITGTSGSGVQQVSVSGTVPINSDLNYTLSLYVKKGTAPSIDLYGIFSGSSTVTSSINYNFVTGVVTASNGVGGFLPVHYGAIDQQLSSTSPTAGWYRLWFTLNDTTGLNTQLQYRIYPKGYNGAAGQYSFVYGAQAEVSRSSYNPSFYLEVPTVSKHTAYANYNITGSGTGVVTIGDEVRSNSVFQTRVVTDSNGVTGGAGYLTASNNAQAGTTQYIQLAQSDTNTNGNYTGMRIFINSGTGAGQYGYISYYNSNTKYAYVLKESFDTLQVTNTSSVTNAFTLGGGATVDTLYVDQPVQFIPTYYTSAVTSTSLRQTTATAAIGGTTNTFTVASTLGMYKNMPITFTGATLFSDVSAGYTYYIYDILDDTTIQITQQSFGNIWPLNTATGTMTINFPSNASYLQGPTDNMVVNYPIQFTGTALGGLNVGTVYYINDIIDGSNFTISGALVNVTVTATNSSNNGLTVTSTSSLTTLNPIKFTSTFGNVVEGTKYYVSSIIDSTTFTIASSLISVTATTTEAVSNLITVSSTTGFVVNQPIRFVGTTFGNIVAETTYYILVVNDANTFTISQTPGGGALTLASASGSMTANTCPTPFVVSSSSGTMAGTTTSTKTSLSLGIGSMNATFSTSLFGGVNLGQTYFINTIGSGSFTVTDTQGNGIPITLTTKSGSMNLAAVGWDHINAGTPAATLLDSSSVYYIEPRTVFTPPPFVQSAATSTVTLAALTNWISIAHGNGVWMALPSGNSTAASSTDGSTWSSISLPAAKSWTDIAYGNGYWVAISSGGSSNSTAAVSKSNGIGWRTTNLPLVSNWSKVAYGNGVFVALSSTSAEAAYSTDYGATWNITYLPGTHTFTAGAGATISTAQAAVGTSSLNLTGGASAYVSSASAADFGYGTGDFTIECWARVSSLGSAQAIIDQRAAGNDVAVLLEVSAAGNPRLYISGSYVITHGTSVSTNTWFHVAVVRASGTTTLYLNGVAAATTYSDSNNYAAKALTIGAYYTGATRLTGYIDEFRISKGIARYTSGFTPSNIAFTSDSYTKALLHFEGANGSTAVLSSVFDGTLSGLVYGNDRFIAVASGSQTAFYSNDGITWVTTTLPATSTWSGVAFGNGMFNVVSSTSRPSAYTFDGVTWYSSNLSVSAERIVYGQGVFLALTANSTTAWTTEGGTGWTKRTVTADAYSALCFGFTSTTKDGYFVTLAGQATGSIISAGCKTKGRAQVVSGTITAITEWEPGSGYANPNIPNAKSPPTVTFTDPNITTLTIVDPRIGNGVLSSPTFFNKGNGYNSSSTVVIVTGNGYSDQYQTGLTVILNNLTRLPQPGDNLTIAGVSQIYKVTSAYSVYSTNAPYLEANVSVSPSISTANATANGTAVSIRSLYSQARLTNHDFLNIGYGDLEESNYPGFPDAGYSAQANNQVVETNYGRVFFTSTDQDGNFKVGNLFGVQQATGIVTLSASQFGLTGLSSLSLGGIAVGGSSVTITQFSTDSTFTSNSDSVIPTQKAVKSYLTSRLSQGGANTFTGQLTAGSVVVGGPNYIRSAVPNGVAGSVVKMPNKIYFGVQPGTGLKDIGVDGNMAALDFFIRHSQHR